MNVVGIWFPWVVNSFHRPSLSVARDWLSDSSSVFPFSLVTVAVVLSCSVALVIVFPSANMTFSRSRLLNSGASSSLLFGRCWIVGVNPTLHIRGHVNVDVTLSSEGVALLSLIFHLGRVIAGVELSFPVWVWPACCCRLTVFVDNVSAVSKCILSCLLGAMSLTPFLASSMVNSFLGSTSDVAAK